MDFDTGMYNFQKQFKNVDAEGIWRSKITTVLGLFQIGFEYVCIVLLFIEILMSLKYEE